MHEDGQYTTSYDLARLVIKIKKEFPEYYKFFALKNFIYGGTEYETANKIILGYKGVEGMKTGFTNAAGFNLISVAKRNDHRVSSVLLNCANSEKRYQLTRQLLDRGFTTLAEKNLYAPVILEKFDYAKKQTLPQNRLRCCSYLEEESESRDSSLPVEKY